MARASRPPGFDMTYRPTEEFFGPPLLVRLPSFAHAAIALAVIALVLIVERSPESPLYNYMYRTKHLIDAHVLAIAFGVSGTASVVRASMRGVRVRPDWLEYRDVIGSLWPTVRKYRWAQIDQVTLEESGAVTLDLWDGRCELLPKVRDHEGLMHVLEQIARARAIPLRGGIGLDDLDNPYDAESGDLDS